MKPQLLLLGALTACSGAPQVNITMLSIADELNPIVDLEFFIQAGERQAFLRLEGESIPIVEPISLPDGFDLVPLQITARALVGEREVASGTVDLSRGQTEATIRFSVCSNGAPEAEELCDDANLTDGDGCDSTCKPTGCNLRYPLKECRRAYRKILAREELAQMSPLAVSAFV